MCLIRDKVTMKGNDGFSYVYILAIILVCFMFVSAGITITGIFVRKDAAEKAVQSSLDNCGKDSLDIQFPDLIEAESTGDTEDTDSSAYTEAFYNAMDSAFAYEQKSGAAGDETYTVSDAHGNRLFTLTGLSVQAEPDSMTISDGKTERMVYTVTGTLKIPIGAFGFNTEISVPIRKTAAYQYAASTIQ